MSQHDYDLANQAGAAFRSDVNNALAAILSLNSGLAAPSVTVAGMLWYDTTNGLVKQRNAANSAWIVRWTVANAEGTLGTSLLFATDATYDIGAAGATRPRDAYLSRNLTLGGSISVPLPDGSAVFALDGSADAGQSVANNATITPFGNANNFAGAFLVVDQTSTGECALFITGGSACKLAFQTATHFSETATTASKINAYLNANVVTIENKMGVTITLRVLPLRVRNQQ